MLTLVFTSKNFNINTVDDSFSVWGAGFNPGEPVIIQILIDNKIKPILGSLTANASGGIYKSMQIVCL